MTPPHLDRARRAHTGRSGHMKSQLLQNLVAHVILYFINVLLYIVQRCAAARQRLPREGVKMKFPGDVRVPPKCWKSSFPASCETFCLYGLVL